MVPNLSLPVAILPLYQLYCDNDKIKGMCGQQTYWHQRQISYNV
uniref:Uncharacterized protein n=1 Tax=Anguilla anguilla TaxID=7936 RepID=A0A0E9Y1L3_ANGAN